MNANIKKLAHIAALDCVTLVNRKGQRVGMAHQDCQRVIELAITSALEDRDRELRELAENWASNHAEEFTAYRACARQLTAILENK